MSRIKLSPDEADIRYSNWLSTLIDLCKPTNLYLFAGRGTAKSTDILAKRIIDIVYDMPRAPLAFVSNTYMNLITNYLPEIIQAWESRMNFYEGTHFVVGEKPPDWFEKPYTRLINYKYSLTFFNGCKILLKSLDRPSINAGISVVHQFGDEVKYLKENKIKKFFPTLRGDAMLYEKSHYFMGQTFTGDMADPSLGEDDWMLRMEPKMNKEVIMMILQCAFVVNDINLEQYQAEQKGISKIEIELIKKKKARWEERLRKIRQDSTLFYIVSSFVNADVLTLRYFENLLNTLTFDEFKLVVLSIPKKLEAGAMFYGNLSDKHFYQDGYNYEFYDRQGFRDNINQTSEGLKYVQRDRPLEAGFDAGNMMSLVIGQEQGNTYRVLKNFFVLTPEWIRELADKFVSFFPSHKYKLLELYYDRAANQYRKAGKDFATQLKNAIENDSKGNPTSWRVKLMSVGQANIFHSEEYDLMNVLMGEKNSKLPKLQIDQNECKELKCSLELAPLDKNAKGQLIKVKKSEKLSLQRLPLESTNMSDAFKYLLCRPKYLNVVKSKRLGFGSSSGISTR